MASNRPWRARPGDLDRRQGIDDPEARGLRPRGRQAGRPVHPLPGAVLRAVLLPGPGRPVLQLHRADPGRPDHQADAGPRQADRHGRRRADVRGGRARPRASTTTPRPSSTPTARTSASTARRTSRTSRASGRSSTSAPGTSAIPVFETAVGKIGVYICYDRHFPEGARALGLNGAEIVLIPSATSRGLSEYLWRIEQVSHAVANGYFVGTINRVGIEADYRRRRLLRPELLRRPARPVRRRRRQRPRRGAAGPRPRPRPDHRGPQHLAVLPRPPARRVRGPHATLDTRYHPSGSAVWRRTAEPPRFPARETTAMQFGFTLKPEHTPERTLALDPPGGGRGLRLRLAVRLARPVARPLSAADADGRRDRADAPGHLRDQPRHPRADASPRPLLATLDEISRRPDGPRHRPRRLGAAGPGQAADHDGRHRGGDPASSGPSSPASAIEYEGTELHFPWTTRLDAPRLGRRLRPDGPGDDRSHRRRR